MKSHEIQIVKECIGTAENHPPKFHGLPEDLIIGDPVSAAFGLEDFMNIDKDAEWYAKIIEASQESAIEAEMRYLAGEMREIVSVCAAKNGLVTSAFSRHLHYLTWIEGIKESLRPAGEHDFAVCDSEKLCVTLQALALELLDFLEYVLYSTSGEKVFKNGVRDKGRRAVDLGYFQNHPKAKQSKLRYAI
jgi:hypothetical protein